MTISNRLKYTLHHPEYGDREVSPTGESKLTISQELHNEDNDPLYDYIVKVEGTLVFSGGDYGWLKAIEDDTYERGNELLIDLLDTSTGELLVEGTRIILNDGIFDLDRCTVEIPISTPDVYETFNSNKGTDINFFDLLVSGPFYDTRVLDYIPKFEINYSVISNLPSIGGSGYFDLSSQDFHYYPNKRAQYPGFGVDDEKPEPGYPNAATRLFESNDLTEMTLNASAEGELGIGQYPYHNLYPGDPIAAKNDGWRLYSFCYDMLNDTASGPSMFYAGYFSWCREIMDVAIGAAMTPEWIYVGIVGGMDRYARPPILVPRTNVNKTSFRHEAIVTECIVRLIQTTYVVGLDIDNVVLCTGTGQTFPDGTTTPPTTPIMNAEEDRENENYYSFTSLVNGKSLNDIIQFTVERCDPSLTVVSNFFQINPTTVSTDNYVTGSSSYTNDIMTYQKSDVKRPFATAKATKGMYTPERLFKNLMEMFDVKYRIEGTNFILEHITAPEFIRAATIDLTATPYNKMLNGLRRYSYENKLKLPAKETFAFMEMRPQGDTYPLNDMNGLPITYYGSNVDRSRDSGVMAHMVEGITTDVYYIFIHSGGLGYLIDATTKNPYPVQDAANDTTISDDGFVLVASKLVTVGPSSERYMYFEPPIIAGVNREMNNVLGWAYLQRDFKTHNRNTSRGEMNGVATTFLSTKYIKKSIELPFTYCNFNDFDPFKLVTSALGIGIIKSAKWQVQDQTMTVILGYQE